MNDLGRRDQRGTTVAHYGQRFPQAAGATLQQSISDAQIQAMSRHPNKFFRQFASTLLQQQRLTQKPSWDKLNDDTLYEKSSGRTMPAGPGYRPLVDPAERARFGIPADDKRPYQVDPAGRLINRQWKHGIQRRISAATR